MYYNYHMKKQPQTLLCLKSYAFIFALCQHSPPFTISVTHVGGLRHFVRTHESSIVAQLVMKRTVVRVRWRSVTSEMNINGWMETEWCIVSVRTHSMSYGRFGGSMLVPLCLCVFKGLHFSPKICPQLWETTAYKHAERTYPVVLKHDHRLWDWRKWDPGIH